jgi:hypothetical protein
VGKGSAFVRAWLLTKKIGAPPEAPFFLLQDSEFYFFVAFLAIRLLWRAAALA